MHLIGFYYKNSYAILSSSYTASKVIHPISSSFFRCNIYWWSQHLVLRVLCQLTSSINTVHGCTVYLKLKPFAYSLLHAQNWSRLASFRILVIQTPLIWVKFVYEPRLLKGNEYKILTRKSEGNTRIPRLRRKDITWISDRLVYAGVNYIYLSHGRGKRRTLEGIILPVLNKLRNISLSVVRSCQLAHRCEIWVSSKHVAEDSSLLWYWPWRLWHWIFRNFGNIYLKMQHNITEGMDL